MVFVFDLMLLPANFSNLPPSSSVHRPSMQTRYQIHLFYFDFPLVCGVWSGV